MAPPAKRPRASEPASSAAQETYTRDDLAYFAGFVAEEVPRLLIDAAIKHHDVASALAAAVNKKKRAQQGLADPEDEAKRLREEERKEKAREYQRKRRAELKEEEEKKRREEEQKEKKREYQRQRRAEAKEEASRVIDFDRYSKSAWHELNPRGSMSGSNAFYASGPATDAIKGMLDDMRRKTVRAAPYETKFSAIETTRKIYKSICLSNDVIPHEVRKNSQDWPEYMVPMLAAFTEPERKRLANDRSWRSKLFEIQRIADGMCSRLDEDINKTIDVLGKHMTM